MGDLHIASPDERVRRPLESFGSDRIALTFTSDAAAAVSAVETGAAQAAILLRPMPFPEIETIAHSGERLPRRAASLHPRLFAGLFGYSLEDPVY